MLKLSLAFLCSFMLAMSCGASESRHVVLIHGIHDDGSSMEFMAKTLTSAGYTVHVLAYTPSDGSVGLDILAEQVATAVKHELHAVRKFDVVAFSMGGLVARSYLQKLDGAKRVDKFITISTPNHGTLLAYLLWNSGGKQMRPGSDFLNDLNADLGCYRNIKWSTIKTPFDLTIIPFSSTVIDVAENVSANVAFHPLMVSDHQVNDLVLGFLGEGRHELARD